MRGVVGSAAGKVSSFQAPASSLLGGMGDFYQAGDLLFFAGTNGKSRAISLATSTPWQLMRGLSPSHVGVIADYAEKPTLFEATTLCDLACEIQHKKVKGPQAHDPRIRVRTYQGKVWRLRLADRRTLSDWQSERLTRYLVSKIGETYDLEGAIRSGTLLRFARWLEPSLDSLFCSRYSMAGLRAAEVVDRDIAPGEFTPARMFRDLPHWELYSPLGAKDGASIRLK